MNISSCREALDSAVPLTKTKHPQLSLLQLHFIYISRYTLDSYSENKCILLTGRCGMMSSITSLFSESTLLKFYDNIR